MNEAAILLSFFLNAVFSANAAKNLIICLPDGKIRGTTLVTGNETYYGFLKIPYATPPNGELRFESPQPAQRWDGILNATVESKSCISSTYFQNGQLQSEDCLYVNVYVPTLKPKHKLPVMFWIYGGGFTQGNSSFYGPDFVMKQDDVILVTVNYRLAVLGFISAGDSALPGNLGLKDQNLALKWTKRNIEYFGGDPANITIFGQSAGGTSVGLHLISKLSAGLFRAAIVESGSALVYWAIDYGDPRTTTYLVADAIPGGSYGNDTQALKEFLKTKSVDEIMTAYSKLPSGLQFWPTIEPESDDAFITESPYESLANGRFNRVPIVIGITAEESLYFFGGLEPATSLAQYYDAVPTSAIPLNLHPNATDEDAAFNAIRSIYLEEGETFAGNLVQFARYFSDNGFNRGVIKHAQLASKYVPVYLYQFSYFGWPVTPPYIAGAEKASHGQEVVFLFNITVINYTADEADLLTQKRILKLWTNFAIHLNPTPEKSDLFNNVLWHVFNSDKNLYLNINNTLELRSNLKGDTVPEWDNIFETYGRKPFITY